MNPEELANQLSCPSGEHGIEVGNSMYQSNLNMIKNCIEVLDIQDDFSILELGFGKCYTFQSQVPASNPCIFLREKSQYLLVMSLVCVFQQTLFI